MESRISIAALRKIPLFSELDDNDITEVLRSSALHHYPKGTLLFQENDPYLGFYIVMEGRVKVYRLLEDGKETIFHIMGELQPLAEVPMFVGGGYPANASTLEESTLLFVQKAGFLDRLHTQPEVAIKMLAGLSKRLKVLGAQIENLTALDVRTRLIRYLLDEWEQQKGNSLIPVVELGLTKSLLAAQLGTALETLSRTFRKLQTDGILRVSGKKIFLDDLPRLEYEAGGHGHAH